MFGIAASILFSAPGYLIPYLLPWDLPTMAVWAAIVLAYFWLKENPDVKYGWLALAVAIAFGGLFKETVLVTALLLLAAPWNWVRRISTIVAVVLLSQFLNWVLCGARPDWLFSVQEGAQGGSDRWNPLMLWPLLIANAGSLILMPWLLWEKKDWPLAAACGLFIVLQALNNLACGVYNENRNWLELAPVGWILVGEFFSNKKYDNNYSRKIEAAKVDTKLIPENKLRRQRSR